MTRIAWNIDGNKTSWPPKSIEEKIEIFYRRALGWQLHIADLVANGGHPLAKSHTIKPIEHSGFAVLHICLSYFETVGKIIEEGSRPPKGSKGYFFERGVRSVLADQLSGYSPDVMRDLMSKLYVGARCGLYHNSMTMPSIGLGQPDGDAAFAYDPESKKLVISPERLPRALKGHLETFRYRLLDPKEIDLRQKFERRFNRDNGIAERR